MKKENWSDEIRDADTEEFGVPVMENNDQKIIWEMDEKLAKILGWDEIKKGDDGEPYEVLGVVQAETKAVVFNFMRNLSVDDDRWYSSAYTVSDEVAEEVCRWIAEQM